MTEPGDKAEAAATPGRAAFYRGALTAIALAWSLRLIGLVSVLVVARLLSPRDFGIVGLAMATVALVEIFSALGLRQALLRIAAPERAHLDTAWTIQLALMVLLGLVLAALAPAAALFYGEPALAPVIAVLALRFLFLGAVNIGIVDFDRNMEFGRDLKMRLGVRLAAFAATVAAAVLLRSYWVLVIGLVLQSALHMAASYVFHPYRPRLSLAKRSELLGVSIWMFLAYAAQVIHHEVERLVVGRFAAMHMVGLYSVSKNLSSIFTQEIATALNRVTFVTTARAGPLSDDPARVTRMLGAYAMIAAPLGLGLAATAEDAVAVLLGAQWRDAAPLLQLIGPAAALYAVHKLVLSSLQASGLARGAAWLSGAGAMLAVISLAATAIVSGSATAVASAALAVNAVVLIGGLVALARIAQTGIGRLAAAVARPFAAAGAMLLFVRAMPETGIALANFALGVGGGAAAYAGALLLLWLAVGRPPGAEAEGVTLIGDLSRRVGQTIVRS